MRKIPWINSKKWKQGHWYPIPITHDIEFEGKEFTIDWHSWDLFRLDPRFEPGHSLFGDIVPMGIDVNFITAIKIANAINPEKFWTASWIKETWAQPKDSESVQQGGAYGKGEN